MVIYGYSMYQRTINQPMVALLALWWFVDVWHFQPLFTNGSPHEGTRGGTGRGTAMFIDKDDMLSDDFSSQLNCESKSGTPVNTHKWLH